jgi:hypothetical protein
MTEFIFSYGPQKKPKVSDIPNYASWREAFILNDSPIHWKEGRSAQSLAEDFMLNNKPGRDMLVQIVEQVTGEKIAGQVQVCIEHESVIDGFQGSGRMQDLAAFGNLRSNHSFFIGLEAKVDETFDKTIGEKALIIEEYRAKHPTTKQHERLMNLLQEFLHLQFDKSSFPVLPDVPDVIKNLRYQLLYYLAGSFREDADIIFLPVVVYKSNGLHFECYDSTIGSQNQNDYENFRKALGFKKYKTISFEGKDIEMYSARIKDLKTNSEKEVYTCYIVK